MIHSFDELVQRAGDAWFDPSSGWCLFEIGDHVYLRNPASQREHKLTDSFARGLRYSLKNRVLHPLLQTANRSLNGELSEVLSAVRADRFWSDTSLLEGLGLENPSQLWIEVQGSCNEECVHCYAESAPKKLPSLEPDTVEEILDDAGRHDFSLVQFTGGDPLLWEELPDMVAKTRDLGMVPEVYTNGLLLDRELYETLRPAEPRFAFSLYSHEAVIHDQITQQEGSWDRTVEAIERALAGPTPVRVGVVIMQENQGQEGAIRKFLADRGVPSEKINVSYLQDVGRGRDHAAGGTSDATSDSPSGEAASDGASGGTSDNGHFSGERRSFNPGKLCVSYTGSVIPCIFQRDVTLGNIHKRDLGEILENPTLDYTVDARREGTPEPGGPGELSCSECRFHSFMLHYVLQGNVTRSSSTSKKVGLHDS